MRVAWVLETTAALIVAVAVSAFAYPVGAASPAPRGEGTVVFDFESGDTQGWHVVEGRFDRPVADIPFFHNRPKVPYNKQGRYYLNTIERTGQPRTDAMTGVLESPVFRLAGPRVTFLVGGGSHKTTYVAVCTAKGREVRKACGRNTETMERVTWDLPDLVGKRVFLRIVDRHTGGWGHVTFDDFRARGAIDAAATAARAAQRGTAQADAARAGVQGGLDSVRRAVTDLRDTFGPRYAGAGAYLERLDDLQQRAGQATPKTLQAMGKDLDALAREALLANPLVSGYPILFVVRAQYKSDHHNTATMFQVGEINAAKFDGGGAVKCLHVADGGRVETLLELPDGVARDPDVHFDGRRILLAVRNNAKDDYHIHELDVGPDGRGTLRQLTHLAGVSDIDPCYLPDGRILFTSTREPKFCMCNRHIMGNLFRMDADGANVHQVGHSTLHEGHPALMPDGSVLYDRWEYVDRNFGDAQGVWLCRPDGTNHAIFWGNNTPSPGAVIDARAIPGTERFVATFTSCHDRPWGAIAVVDRTLGIDGKAPVVRTWPPDARDLVMVGNYDTYKRVKPKYEDPYPLHDPAVPGSAGKYFLAARQADGGTMGIFLVDVFGNEVLLHAEAPGCFDPMPLASRPAPPVIPDRTDFAKADGVFYLHDAYIGTGMETVPRGTVKFLRIIESPEKRFWTQANWNGSGTQAPGMNWDDFNNKRVVGTVPVEADGSAYFRVPADRFVYFQLLDEKKMMVQSMRSGTIVRPGESQGCIGCHENRLTAVPNTLKAAALRPPSTPEPPFGRKPFLFNYLTEVQPIWDRHCLACHDFGGKAAKQFILAGDLTRAFNVSYMELRRKRLVTVVGAGPAAIQKPYAWGSHASKLVQHLLKSSTGKRLSPEEFERIVTWVDINAPYYPSYASTYRANLYGRCPIGPGDLKRLKALTGVDVLRRPHDPLISFTRPEKSPCLAPLAEQGGAKYNEALAIIDAGRNALAKEPREDMPGAELRDNDRDREAKYARLLRQEEKARQAIAAQRKVYDPKS